jgi:hypothetical protein
MKKGFEPEAPTGRPFLDCPPPPPTPRDVERVEQHMTLQGMERQGLHNTAFGILYNPATPLGLREHAKRYLVNLLIAATDDLKVKL